MDWSVVTDYKSLYVTGYFGHAAEITSFAPGSTEEFALGLAKTTGCNVLVDLGGGNGAFAQGVNSTGFPAVWTDVADINSERFKTFDLSQYDPESTDSLRIFVEAHGQPYFVTCFDVAEHIDIEHIHSLISNLSEIISSSALISISTRPSSMGNRYHSTVMPIQGWQTLFSRFGLESHAARELDTLRTAPLIQSETETLWAISHWQHLNPFLDAYDSHQHYLRLVPSETSPAWPNAAERVSGWVDVAWRGTKRGLQPWAGNRLVVLLVDSLECWFVVRSLLDFTTSAQVRIALLSGAVPEPFKHLIANFCIRCGLECRVLGAFDDFAAVAAEWSLCATTVILSAGSEQDSTPAQALLRAASGQIAQAGATALAWRIDPQVPGPVVLDSSFPAERDAAVIRLGLPDQPGSLRLAIRLPDSGLDEALPSVFDSIRALARDNPEHGIVVLAGPHDRSILPAMPPFGRRSDPANLVVLDSFSQIAMDLSEGRVFAMCDAVACMDSAWVSALDRLGLPWTVVDAHNLYDTVAAMLLELQAKPERRGSDAAALAEWRAWLEALLPVPLSH